MTNPTERSEERDSLAQIEERLARSYAPPASISGDPEWSDGFDWADAMRDLRTLINEVKERDRTIREREEEAHKQAVKRFAAEDRIAALVAEVQNARLIEERIARQDEALQVLNARLDEAEDAERRVEQMEEALREAENTLVAADSDVSWCLARHKNSSEDKYRVRNTLASIRKLQKRVRAALSPSDTEEG